jgi:hypothetical protein
MMSLATAHLSDLRRSGLSDATIAAAGLYTESDPRRISEILHWSSPADPLGHCLVFPFRLMNGELNGFARVKPSRPRTDGDSVVKYEQPRGEHPRPYFTLEAIAAAKEPGRLIAITEGEKKALAASQADVSCIGLCGVFAWQQRREKQENKPKGDRLLVPELAAIDWVDRPVPILFDTDPRRNPNVNLAGAELVRVLADLGAKPVLINLPVGPRDATGVPGKMGVDDFIVAHGEQAFRDLVNEALKGNDGFRDLKDYRKDMARARKDSLDVGAAIYLDTSPTGSGKTFTDTAVARAAKSSLTVLRTHRNCREVEEEYQRAGLLAASYPELSAKVCRNFEQATIALGAGLSASATVCLECPHNDTCEYREAMDNAEGSPHALATHKRAELSFETIAEGRKYITIHEDPVDLLAPTAEAAAGLDQVAQVARHAGAAAWDRNDMDGRYFFGRVEEAAHWLMDRLADTTDTTSLPLPLGASSPRQVDANLWRAMNATGIFPPSEPMRICKAIAAGELHELTIRVDRCFGKGKEQVTRRAVLAVWHTKLPPKATVWINDATADLAEIQAVSDRPVLDMTPEGRLRRQHPAVQIPLDVKKGTSVATVISTVRGVLASIGDYRQIGVVCDQKHVPALRGTSHGDNLDPHSRSRIVKIEHFRSGESRGSNLWLEECDLLLILGTPRVPPYAIKQRLIRSGRSVAAARDGGWEKDYWSGVTVSGKRRTVQTLAYRDRDWHTAHQAIVRAELLQAVGRGRGICDNGLPVAVVSCEDLGLPLFDTEIHPIDETAWTVLEALRDLSTLSDVFPKGGSRLLGEMNTPRLSHAIPNNNIGLTSLSRGKLDAPSRPILSSELAHQIGRTKSWVCRILNSLFACGLVHRIGQRGGWVLSGTGRRLVAPEPAEPIDRPAPCSIRGGGAGEALASNPEDSFQAGSLPGAAL